MREPTALGMAASFEYHRQHPEITIDQHVKAMALVLAESLKGVEKIYLDKRFWVLLRDAHMARSMIQSAYELLG